MKFESYYSSSMGNLYCVTAANGKRLLVECGCTWAKLQKAINYKLENIAGCLLTHEHADHSKAVEDVIRAGIDVYSGMGTLKALDIDWCRHTNPIHSKHAFRIGDTFNVFPFAIDHDAKEPLGFVISTPFVCDQTLLFATDTRSIKPKFALAFDIIAICCGYDGAVLRQREADGTIDPSLAKRLLVSHLEKQVALDYIDKFCNLSKCTEIFLLHMSKSNIDAEKTRQEFESNFFVKTVIA